MRKQASVAAEFAKAVGLVALVALVVGVYLSFFEFAGCVRENSPYWTTVALFVIVVCLLIVRGISWLDRRAIGRGNKEDGG